jgi:hypothetical protein
MVDLGGFCQYGERLIIGKEWGRAPIYGGLTGAQGRSLLP